MLGSQKILGDDFLGIFAPSPSQPAHLFLREDCGMVRKRTDEKMMFAELTYASVHDRQNRISGRFGKNRKRGKVGNGVPIARFKAFVACARNLRFRFNLPGLHYPSTMKGGRNATN